MKDIVDKLSGEPFDHDIWHTDCIHSVDVVDMINF